MSRVAGQDDVERVREATNLVALIAEHIQLKPRGREHVGLCPFHDDHRPSFAVVTHKGNAFYKCHACGAAGDALRFVMDYHKLAFPEALKMLADRAGIVLQGPTQSAPRGDGPTRSDLREITTRAGRYFQRCLDEPVAGERARSILADRGIDDDLRRLFEIGFAPSGYSSLAGKLRDGAREAAVAVGLLKCRSDGSVYDSFRNRLIFPIADETGRPIAFGGRRVDPDDEPKYLNSSESPLFHKSRTLYALHLARRSIIERREAIVVEGYTDVIACHRAGVTNAVGTLGTALTREHARVLARVCDTIVLVFDGDEAGQRAADRGVQAVFSEPVDVRICVLPDGQDPDELLGRENGVEAFRDALARGRDALDFKVDRFAATLATQTTLSGKQKLSAEFLQELADLGFASMQGVRKRLVVTRLAELLGVTVRDIERSMPKARRGHASAEPARPRPAAPITSPTLAIAGSSVSRSQMLAEHGLLAVLVFEPSLGRGTIDTDQCSIRVVDAISPEDFLDPAARAIAGFVFESLRRESTFTMEELLQGLDDEARALAGRLYFEGERACGEGSERAAEALGEAINAMERCHGERRFREQAASRRLRDVGEGERLRVLEQLLEQRRQCGDIPSAIGQDVRT